MCCLTACVVVVVLVVVTVVRVVCEVTGILAFTVEDGKVETALLQKKRIKKDTLSPPPAAISTRWDSLISIYFY